MKQKEAVYLAFVAIANGRDTTECLADSTFRAQLKEAVAAGLHDGSTDWDFGDKTPEACLAYASQLIANWTKRDTRISGMKYEPLTKRGPQIKDERLQKLNVALKAAQVHCPDKVEQITSLIDARKAELNVVKAKTKVIDATELTNVLAELGI